MLAFVIRRLLQSVLVMLAVGFIAFSLFNFTGDPVALMLPPEATQADREEVRKSLGLDEPSYVQFAVFVKNAVQGNFGISLRLGRPVSQLLVERLPATLELAMTAAVLGLLIGIPMGILTALKRDIWLSKLFLTGSLTLALSRTGRIDRLSGGICHSDDLGSLTPRMVKYCTAGFKSVCVNSAKNNSESKLRRPVSGRR